MNGFEVVEQMAAMATRPPVVVITALPEGDPEVQRLDGRVVSAVLRKPFDVAATAAVVKELAMSSHRGHGEERKIA
jgi:DNA-binding response OmpR family regulator